MGADTVVSLSAVSPNSHGIVRSAPKAVSVIGALTTISDSRGQRSQVARSHCPGLAQAASGTWPAPS